MKTARFGDISYNDQDVVHFRDGIPGFERLRRFLLLENQEFAPLKFFQAVDDPNISLPLLQPQSVADDYRFDLPKSQRDELGLSRPEDAAVFCVVTIHEDPTASTINLMAPVVINLTNRKAAQLVLFGSDYPVAAPLLSSAEEA